MDFLGHQGKFCGNYGLTKIKLELKMEGKKRDSKLQKLQKFVKTKTNGPKYRSFRNQSLPRFSVLCFPPYEQVIHEMNVQSYLYI